MALKQYAHSASGQLDRTLTWMQEQRRVVVEEHLEKLGGRLLQLRFEVCHGHKLLKYTY